MTTADSPTPVLDRCPRCRRTASQDSESPAPNADGRMLALIKEWLEMSVAGGLQLEQFADHTLDRVFALDRLGHDLVVGRAHAREAQRAHPCPAPHAAPRCASIKRS